MKYCIIFLSRSLSRTAMLLIFFMFISVNMKAQEIVNVECTSSTTYVFYITGTPSNSNFFPGGFFFGTNNPENGLHQGTLGTTEPGGYTVVFSGVPCDDSFTFQAFFLDGNPSVTFINGQQCTDCPDPAEYGDGVCSDLFESCWFDLTVFIDNNSEEILCKPWEGECDGDSPIYHMGQVGIGTSSNTGSANIPGKLMVKDGIITDKVKVEWCSVLGWCDYVFEEDYNLLSLEEVDAFIKKNGHLHNTSSATVIEEKGSFELKATTINQQEKIEEIFLHLIDLDKEATDLIAELELALKENELLKEQMKDETVSEGIDLGSSNN